MPIITHDGSHTLFSSIIDEHYHSLHGAVQESMHVFIEAALRQCAKNQIHVLEIGFGSGLNAFLSLLEAERTNKNIHYTSIELYPLDEACIRQLNYASQIAPDRQADFDCLHTAAWNVATKITPHFTLEKILTDFTNCHLPNGFDVIFFDAFSPEKQPEMWTDEIFARLYAACNNHAILTTYCAKGYVRRAMQKAGFVVERLEGSLGKREMLRGLVLYYNQLHFHS